MLDDAVEVVLDALGYGFDGQAEDRSIRMKILLFIAFFFVLIGVFVIFEYLG